MASDWNSVFRFISFKRWYTIISSSKVCWVIVSGLFKFVQKIVGTVFELIWCLKTRFFQIFTWYTLRTLQYLKSSLVCDNLSLLYTTRIACFCWLYIFLKVFPGCTFQCNVSVVNIGMYVRMIQMFIYIGVCLIQQPNIFSNFTFNIFTVFFSA